MEAFLYQTLALNLQRLPLFIELEEPWRTSQKKSCWNSFRTEKIGSTWCLERKHENCSSRTFFIVFFLF